MLVRYAVWRLAIVRAMARSLEMPALRMHRSCRSAWVCGALTFALLPCPSNAQTAPSQSTGSAVIGGNVKQHANAVLSIMTYTTVPDVTTSNLSVNSGNTGNPSFGQTQFGGGFTISKSFPLYRGHARLQPLRSDLYRYGGRGAACGADKMEHFQWHGGRRLGFPDHG